MDPRKYIPRDIWFIILEYLNPWENLKEIYKRPVKRVRDSGNSCSIDTTISVNDKHIDLFYKRTMLSSHPYHYNYYIRKTQFIHDLIKVLSLEKHNALKIMVQDILNHIPSYRYILMQ